MRASPSAPRAAAAEQARLRALNRERVIKLQQPRTGGFASLKPAKDAWPAEVAGARAQLVASVETAITADAQKRAATRRDLQGPGPDHLHARRGRARRPGPIGVFDCYTVVRKVPKVETNVAGSIGYPFRAVVNYSTFTYAFCRTEQFPGEQLIPDPRTVVQLPAAACRAERNLRYIATLYCVAMENLADELDQRLTALWHVLGRRGKRELSRTAASVLATLRDTGPRRITELAESEGIAQPTVTTLVGRLERDGLVERRADPATRAPCSSHLTQTGLERLDAMRAAREAVLEKRLAALTEHEREVLANALPVLDKLMEEGPDE